MKQNLANRLAAGGYWAIIIAQMSVELTQRMREDGVTVPIGSGSDVEVFVMCGVQSFEIFCNADADNGFRMNVQMQMAVPSTGGPRCYDRNCQPISLEQWSALQDDEQYKRVAYWRNDAGRHVSTVWTGVDPNGCDRPHIFESMVVSVVDGRPNISHMFRYYTLAEAQRAHQQIVALVKMGRL